MRVPATRDVVYPDCVLFIVVENDKTQKSELEGIKEGKRFDRT